MRRWVIVLAVYVLLFLVYVYFFGSEVQPADWMQVMLMTALVGVTIFYAWSTHKQAESSAQTVVQMREQIVMTSRAVVIQKAVNKSDIIKVRPLPRDVSPAILRSEYYSHFVVTNIGHGPAIELEFSLMGKDKNQLYSQRITYLKPGEEINFEDEALAQREESIYYLVCEYKLAFPIDSEHKWQQTWLSFQLSKASKEGRVYIAPGELEFKEVADKDRIAAFHNKPS